MADTGLESATPARDGSREHPALVDIDSLADLAALVEERPGLYVRWSRGPAEDAGERSCDHASGLSDDPVFQPS